MPCGGYDSQADKEATAPLIVGLVLSLLGGVALLRIAAEYEKAAALPAVPNVIQSDLPNGD